jgi:hypothetical protein
MTGRSTICDRAVFQRVGIASARTVFAPRASEAFRSPFFAVDRVGEYTLQFRTDRISRADRLRCIPGQPGHDGGTAAVSPVIHRSGEASGTPEGGCSSRRVRLHRRPLPPGECHSCWSSGSVYCRNDLDRSGSGRLFAAARSLDQSAIDQDFSQIQSSCRPGTAEQVFEDVHPQPHLAPFVQPPPNCFLAGSHFGWQFPPPNSGLQHEYQAGKDSTVVDRWPPSIAGHFSNRKQELDLGPQCISNQFSVRHGDSFQEKQRKPKTAIVHIPGNRQRSVLTAGS